MNSLKTNVLLNLINTITGIIFPVITFPYAARILLPDGIGTVNFLSSIINYLVLLTGLGIPVYAVREVAKYRDDVALRNKITVEITLLSVILCSVGYVMVFLLARYVPQIHAQTGLFYILSLTILFTSIGVQWFYQAIEDFLFITIRAVAIRMLAAISLFVFVKSKEDLLIYGAVVVGSTVGNNLINLVHLRKYIEIAKIKWRELQVARHLKPAIRIFILNLIISIYFQLNAVMLGFMQNEEAVGFYTAGSKISYVILSVITSLGVVLLPRCSNLVKNGKMSEFAAVGQKAYRLVLASALPCMVGLLLLAGPITEIFCGKSFLPSVPVLYWTAPIIIFISVTNVFSIQLFYPQNQENIIIWSAIGGAIMNVVLNLFLIPRYSYTGAAIATFWTELTVLIIQAWVGRKFIPFPIFHRDNLKYVWATLIMLVAILVVTRYIASPFLMILAAVGVGVPVYGLALLGQKDDLLNEILIYVKLKQK